jgi:hypothetical protein
VCNQVAQRPSIAANTKTKPGLNMSHRHPQPIYDQKVDALPVAGNEKKFYLPDSSSQRH